MFAQIRKNLGNVSSLMVALFLVACGGGGVPENSNLNNSNENTNGAEEVCGDGIVNGEEQCDDGSANSDTAPNACRTDCRSAYCGDGIIDSNEECDNSSLADTTCESLGYTKGRLACSDQCSFNTTDCSFCGDGEAEGSDPDALGYETCDGSDLRGETCISIGQADGQLSCTNSCTWDISGCVGSTAICGNGQVEMGEQCDDGNTDACDGCSPTCVLEGCGNGVIECGETCDDGNGINTDSCPDGVGGTCESAVCGDGFLWANHETCDDGNTTDDATCYGDCSGFCGDGVVNSSKGETCDDGNVLNDPECYSDCQSSCGDGAYQPTFEDCDYAAMGYGYDPITGVFEHNPSCTETCTVPYCGDGICSYMAMSSFEDGYSCPVDCEGSVLAGTDCGGGHWCPHELISMDGRIPGMCCGNGECVKFNSDYGNVSHGEVYGIENCTGCGIDCASDEMCDQDEGCCRCFGGSCTCHF